MTGIPSSLAAQAEQAWVDEPDRTVLWVNAAGDIWIVARDGRAGPSPGRSFPYIPPGEGCRRPCCRKS